MEIFKLHGDIVEFDVIIRYVGQGKTNKNHMSDYIVKQLKSVGYDLHEVPAPANTIESNMFDGKNNLTSYSVKFRVKVAERNNYNRDTFIKDLHCIVENYFVDELKLDLKFKYQTASIYPCEIYFTK